MAKASNSVYKMDLETARETSMIDLAYDMLKESGKPMGFREIMEDVAKIRQMTPEEVEEFIAILYTEINIDGRFICVGNNTWGLKRWYPVDKTSDKAADKKFIRKDDDFDDDDDDVYLDEEFEEEALVYDEDEIEDDVLGDLTIEDDELDEELDDDLVEKEDVDLDLEDSPEEDEDL